MIRKRRRSQELPRCGAGHGGYHQHVTSAPSQKGHSPALTPQPLGRECEEMRQH